MWTSAALHLCVFAVALTGTGCDRIESRIIARVAGRALAGDHTELLEDGQLHIVLCGTGSPLADKDRAGACTAVIAGGHFVLVDVGPGAWKQVALERLPRARLDAILLTHFHSDHIGDLGEATMQSWVAGRSTPLSVYGPPGVEQVVNGFVQAYALDTQYRIAHHGAEALPPAAGIPVAHTVALGSPDQGVVVFEADGLRVTAFAVNHQPVAPAYGYRFDYRGRSVVISGDTKKSATLIAQAHNADVIVHEALAAHMIRPAAAYAREHQLPRWAKLATDILSYHTTPVEAAEVAKAANARMLVLSHLVPPLQNFIARRLFLRGVSAAWDGRVELGYDGMELTLPPAAESIAVGSLG
jgi:ribonuclease Z